MHDVQMPVGACTTCRSRAISCDCIDFNPRQRKFGKPCKHIYKGLLHLAANCAAEDVLVYAQEKLSQKMKK